MLLPYMPFLLVGCLSVALCFESKLSSMYPALDMHFGLQQLTLVLSALTYCNVNRACIAHSRDYRLALQADCHGLRLKQCATCKHQLAESVNRHESMSMSAWCPGAAASAGRSSVRAAAAAGAAPGHSHARQARQTGDVQPHTSTPIHVFTYLVFGCHLLQPVLTSHTCVDKCARWQHDKCFCRVQLGFVFMPIFPHLVTSV